MRILHFDYDDINNPFAGGGQAKATREINKRLARHDHVLVVTGAYPGCKRKEVLDGVTYMRIGIGSLGPVMSVMSYWMLIPIYAAMLSGSFDVIVEYFTAPFTASLIPFFSLKPIVGCMSFFDSGALGRKYHVPFGQIAEVLIKRYKYVIALSRWSEHRLHTVAPKLLTCVIPRGVEADLLEARPKDGNYALYLGRIDLHHKGLDVLMQAWKLMHTKYGNRCPRLVIAGNGKRHDESRLHKLIDEEQLSSRVRIVGRVGGKRKVNLLKNCRYVVYPSRFEGFGNVALEAMAASKTCVVFDIPGFGWIKRGRAMKVDRIDASALVEALEHLNSDRHLRQSIGRRGRKEANEYRWEKVASMHARFYREVLATHDRLGQFGGESANVKQFSRHFS